MWSSRAVRNRRARAGPGMATRTTNGFRARRELASDEHTLRDAWRRNAEQWIVWARAPLHDGIADLAVAFMSLQDVDDVQRAVREAARVLAPAGRLCLAIVHPLNSAGQFADDTADGRFVIDGSYLRSRILRRPDRA